MAQILEQEAEVLPPTQIPALTGVWDADDGGRFFTRQTVHLLSPGPALVWGYGAHVFPQGYEVVFETTRTDTAADTAILSGKWVDLHAIGATGHGLLILNVERNPPPVPPADRFLMTPDQATIDSGFPTALLRNFRDSGIAPHIQPDSAPRLHVPSVGDISGYWNGNDNGLYLVRQINNEIWWRGIANDGSFSNVYSATRSGNSISGTWADVTVGSTQNQGQLILQIVMLPGSPIPLLQRTSESGGFGGSIWLPLRNI